MSKSKKKERPTMVRFDEETRKQLEKEAEAKGGLALGTYIRMLVLTHPERQKKK